MANGRWSLALALTLTLASGSVAAGCGAAREHAAAHRSTPTVDGGNGGADGVASATSGAGAGGNAPAATFTPGEPIPLDEVAEPLLEAYCAYLVRCGQAVRYEQVPGGCVAALGPASIDGWAERVAQGTAIYEPTAAQACIDAYRDRRCDDPEYPAACQATFDGTVALGEPCDDNGQCAGTAFCGGCPGRCTSALVEGEACDDTHWCAASFICSMGACSAYAREGEVCGQDQGADDYCAGGEPCVSDTNAPSGTCQAWGAAKVGEDCGRNLGLLCESGAACVVTEQTADGLHQVCVKRARSGGSCQRGEQDACPVGEYCPLSYTDTAAGRLTAKCRPLAQAGEKCAASNGCLPGSACLIGDTCVKLGSVGDTCGSYDECDTGICKQGHCSAYDACDDAVSEPPLQHDISRPAAEQCPTETAGQLLEAFDTAESVTVWDDQFFGGGGSVVDWSEEERFSCSGALHLHATLTAAPQDAFAMNPFDSPTLLDWSGHQRLHLWVRLAPPGVGAVEGLLFIRGAIATLHEDLETGELAETSVDASWLRDFDWHELVVELPSTDLERVQGYGISVGTAYELPKNAPKTLPEIDVYLDDVWLE